MVFLWTGGALAGWQTVGPGGVDVAVDATGWWVVDGRGAVHRSLDDGVVWSETLPPLSGGDSGDELELLEAESRWEELTADLPYEEDIEDEDEIEDAETQLGVAEQSIRSELAVNPWFITSNPQADARIWSTSDGVAVSRRDGVQRWAAGDWRWAPLEQPVPVQPPPGPPVDDLAVSGDLLVAVRGGRAWLSRDEGKTWTVESGPRIRAVAAYGGVVLGIGNRLFRLVEGETHMVRPSERWAFMEGAERRLAHHPAPRIRSVLAPRIVVTGAWSGGGGPAFDAGTGSTWSEADDWQIFSYLQWRPRGRSASAIVFGDSILAPGTSRRRMLAVLARSDSRHRREVFATVADLCTERDALAAGFDSRAPLSERVDLVLQIAAVDAALAALTGVPSE